MRLFVAIDLPWSLRERLADLTIGLPGVRWIPPENHHLTMRFVGEVPRYAAEEIDAELAAITAPGFPLELTGVGTMEKGSRVMSLYAGVTRNPALIHLRSKVETALQRAGQPPERRRFLPHITLARLGDQPFDPRLIGWVQAHNLFRANLQVESFTLFSSQLGKDQATYTAEVDYTLS